MHNYQDLEGVKRARRLVSIVCDETASFPSEEKFGLKRQMRGSANSIGANLAEGAGRLTPGEFRQFVSQPSGSAYELEWQTLIASDLSYLQPANSAAIHTEVIIIKKLLYRLAKSLPPRR